jgi:hypothetical protein
MEILQARRKINKWGTAGILLGITVAAVPFRNPWCLLWPLMLTAATICSIVAVVRGSKYWLILSLITGLVGAQSVWAVLVEC